jgi:hypothetical protein
MTALADVTDPRFTPDQLATLAAFDAAPTPLEVREAAVLEEVARAIYDKGAYCGDCPYDDWDSCPECRRYVREYAVAAVAAYRSAQDGGAEEAVDEPAWIAAFYRWAKTDKSPGSYSAAFAAGYRAALATQAGDGGGQQ